jgi:hypothetical protein
MLLQNKYDLKKPKDFTVFEGHGYPLVWHNIYPPIQIYSNGFTHSSQIMEMHVLKPPI